ncbi:MAG: protein translocase subunit SecD [Lachnospiraceae bacterium]|jgi:SecD/SecF fusion protein|nr:protein translocase subunit SecD [Lachnospiraceae bacterium]
MKNVKRGVLHILLVVLAIAALGYIAIVGIGNQHKGTAEHIRLGLDLAGGVSVTYQTEKENPTTREMDDTIYKLQMRVEGLGEEPVVYKEGSNRINVDIPGAKDADAVLKKLGKSGNILFINANDLKKYLKNPDAGVRKGAKLGVEEQKLYDANVVICDGSDIDTASAETVTKGTSRDYVVALEFNGNGAKKFAEGTEKAINGQIAIVYDGVVISSPNVSEAITGGKAQIEGQSSIEEAEELASTIRIGALPISLKEIRSQVVGAKLGDSAIQSSLLAGVIGLIIIIAFMIAFYRIPGLAASIALIFYVGAISFTLNCFNVTLTLPGIAGILLSIGMAVDANVIIFTRIKEELAEGNSLETSMKNGFDKALSAIVDGNITTIIASVILLLLGSGTVASFAKTLLIGVLLSMFTALFVTRFALNALISLGATDVKFFGKAKKTKKFAFVKNFPKFVAVALVFIAICVGSLIYNKANTGTILNYGLDFKGGTSTSVAFNKDVVADDIKSDVEKLVKDTLSVNPEISEVKGKNTLTIKTTVLDKAQREKLSKAVSEKYNVKEDTIESETISASVSNEMKRDAVMAITVAVILMLLYIAVRFKDITFGASAILALIHDVLIVLMAYGIGSALGIITVGNTFIACMLTILGYSINSTIVTFDRIRENRQAMGKKADLEDIVNTSVSQTITRNINTTLTTFIMIFMLLLLGVSSLREFTIPLIAGLIAGAFSSICLTSALWYHVKRLFSSKKK